MILIKGSHVQFETKDGRRIKVPTRNGLIHDTEGTTYSKCKIYVGPYTKTRELIEPPKDAKDYFGKSYAVRRGTVNVPTNGWKLIDEIRQVFYLRTSGSRYQGKYFHLFDKRQVVLLSKSGKFYCLELPDRCIVNWRGFVFP